MKTHCDIIRDLLPLYADDACSDESRRLVDEHLQECPDCVSVLEKLKDSEIEEGLKTEKTAVIEYGAKKFRKRSATVGSTVSGLFMIPILACLVINLATGANMGWFFIVLASLAVAASVILVPILVPEDKLFWTFCAFCVSVTILLGVTCIATRGSWFWIASSATLFGLGLVFLPFVIRAKPLQKWVGGTNKALLVIAADMVLFLNMMTAISVTRSLRGNGLLLAIGCVAGIALAALEVYRKRGNKE